MTRMHTFERGAAEAAMLARRRDVLASVEPDVAAWFERCVELHAAGQEMALGEVCPACFLPVGTWGATPGGCTCEPPRDRIEEWARAHGIDALLPILQLGHADMERIREIA